MAVRPVTAVRRVPKSLPGLEVSSAAQRAEYALSGAAAHAAGVFLDISVAMIVKSGKTDGSKIQVFKYFRHLKTRKGFLSIKRTIGKHCILPQLNSNDFLTVIFDGKDIDTVFQEVEYLCQSYPCKSNIIYNPENLGYWGHEIRNRNNKLSGDFIIHADDDDEYHPQAFRQICTNAQKHGIKLIFNNRINQGQIGKQSGVIPSSLNARGYWGL